MRVVVDRGDLAAARQELPRPVALVPTMGALHAGHLALLAAARERAASVVASIFVNPLQFGAGEDLQRYPRPLEADLAACEASGVDLVWTPGVDDVYPGGRPAVTVSAGPLGTVLEGAVRPGHFDGVLTVVLKLVNVVAPDVAVFGQKDAQQLALVRRMVVDLDVPVEVVAVPTVREPDGLARSSRNAYLSDAERVLARAVPASLDAGEAAAAAGHDAVVAAVSGRLAARGLVPDYVALVDPRTFELVVPGTPGPALLVVAVPVGGTRLLDNRVVTLEA